MEIKDLIDIMAELSFASSSSQEERALYLRFLNIANIKAYSVLNDCTFCLEVKMLPVVDGDNYALFSKTNIFTIKDYQAVEGEDPLAPAPFHLRNKLSKGQCVEHNDRVYISSQEKLGTYTDEDGNTYQYINQLIIPKPKKLVEVLEDQENEVTTPIYDERFHVDLVHVAMLYMCMSQKTYLEKQMFYQNNTERFLKELKSYYLTRCPYTKSR